MHQIAQEADEREATVLQLRRRTRQTQMEIQLLLALLSAWGLRTLRTVQIGGQLLQVDKKKVLHLREKA